jgi:hypothetical protein
MPRTFTYPRPRPRGLLGRRLETGEQAFVTAAALVALLALWTLPTWPFKLAGAAAIAAFAGWAAFVPYQGRTFLRWWEIKRTYRRLLRRGRLLYRSAAPTAGRRLSGQVLTVPQPAGVPPMEWLSAPTGYGELAVLMLPTERTFVATLEIEGERDFGGLDEPEREGLIAAFEQLLRSVADGGGRIRRLAWMLRVVPADPSAHARDVTARRDTAAQPWLHSSYAELQRQVAVTSEDRRLFVTVVVPYSQALVAEARGYRTLSEGFARMVAAEAETFIRALPLAQLRLVRTLDEPTLASLIHSLYDPAHHIDDTVGWTRASAWPAEVDGRDATCVKTRSWTNPAPWYSATCWLRELPVTPVGVNFLAPLLLWIDDAIRTVTVIMDLDDIDHALARALADYTNELGQGSSGPVQDPKDIHARARAAQTVEELGAGYAGVTLTGYVTVSAHSADQLAQLRDVTSAAIIKSRMRPEWCETEHWRAFTNTLPLACGLRSR